MTLFDELTALQEQYSDESIRGKWRLESLEQARSKFLSSLISSSEAWDSFCENARNSVKYYGRKTTSLQKWTGVGPNENGHSLADLLDLGTLLDDIQEVLDERAGKGNFIVFKHSITGGTRGPRRYSLTVSWDKERFDNAESIIRTERERAVQRKEQRNSYQSKPRETTPRNWRKPTIEEPEFVPRSA